MNQRRLYINKVVFVDKNTPLEKVQGRITKWKGMHIKVNYGLMSDSIA
jgi:hypothetical protein